MLQLAPPVIGLDDPVGWAYAASAAARKRGYLCGLPTFEHDSGYHGVIGFKSRYV